MPTFPTVYPSSGTYPSAPRSPFTIREKPPLRLHHILTAPSGRTTRWAADEPSPENVPDGTQFSSTAPGGHETAGCSLPRKPGVSYSDLVPFSNWAIQGASGVAWEGQLRDTPRASGDERAITPRGAGYQAHLNDNKSAREIYVDQDFAGWGEPSVERRINLLAASYTLESASATPDETTGEPALVTSVGSKDSASDGGISEALYDAKGIALGSVYYAWKKSANVNTASDWVWKIRGDSVDTFTSATDTGNLKASGPGTGTLTLGDDETFLAAQFFFNSVSVLSFQFQIYWTRLAVYGAHGLTKRGTASATEAQGFYASDVIAHALRTWAPLISFTEGSTGTLTPTSFVIPQLAFPDPTTVGDIVSSANRFHLRDWFVWEGQRLGQPTFYYHDRGARGKAWRARIRPAQLEETGQSADRIWNGILVRYQDVTGETRDVGPPGSGANVEDSSLEDPDPLNPANLKGIRKWDVLDMGGVSTPAGAIEVGRRFLEEANLLDTSGQARLVGYVEDDRGVIHPAWDVHAGDTISFVDAADTSPRRVVKSSYDDSSKTNSVDLDAPPEGLDALLERLQVVLIPLGL